jgi:glycosyltransferase involved in cell wall biosynthesis
LIVQEYVPDYRVAFFTRLRDELERSSIRLVVAAGAAAGEQANRADDAGAAADFVVRVRTRQLRVGGTTLSLRSLDHLARESDLVIAEQAVRHLDIYRFLLRPQGLRVALWGHGRNYVSAQTRIENRIKRLLTLRASWFFAYTPGGAEAVVASGFPPQRVTVVQNSIDTSSLRKLVSAVTVDERTELESVMNVSPGTTCLFVGALDSSKRLDFLFAACRIAYERLPEFALIVAGDGPRRAMVEETATQEPWLRYFGRASPSEKARLAAVSTALLMPGRVGLVAVDSFALETPIFTTDWPWHAPEFEYLRAGENAVITADDVGAYSEAIVRALSDRDVIHALRAKCREDAAKYSVEAMAQRFSDGVRSAME